jgi:hypothetical protein
MLVKSTPNPSGSEHYIVFTELREALAGFGGLISGSSNFLLLPQLAQRVKPKNNNIGSFTKANSNSLIPVGP